MTIFDKKYPLLSNTLDSFKTLIGYDLSICRVVFEYQGDEIVFINNAWLGRIRIYLNGSQAYSGWDYTGMIYSSGQFLHKGKIYKIKSVIKNLLTFEQTLTLSIDTEIVDTKTDALFDKLTLKQVGHLMLGAAFVGFLIIGLAKVLGV